MRQFIAPKILKVNGQPAVCECEPGVVCWACVQGNLILWDRGERPEEARSAKMCQEIRRIGQRRVAKNLNIPHTTVAAWVKNERINPSFLPAIAGMIESEG
jgi:hypothetical protein